MFYYFKSLFDDHKNKHAENFDFIAKRSYSTLLPKYQIAKRILYDWTNSVMMTTDSNSVYSKFENLILFCVIVPILFIEILFKNLQS